MILRILIFVVLVVILVPLDFASRLLQRLW